MLCTIAVLWCSRIQA